MRVSKYIFHGIGYGTVMLVSMQNQAQAMISEAISKDEQALSNTERLNFYPKKFTIDFKPDGGGSFDPNCFTVKGLIGSN